MNQLQRVQELLKRVTCNCLDKEFKFIIGHDKIAEKINYEYQDHKIEPRVYIELKYNAICTKGGLEDNWKGRKWYLSPFMTDSEIIFTAYSAFEMCVHHEILEGFKVDGITLFNPHIDYQELLKISNKEVKRI